MNSDVDPESIGHIRAEDSREEKPDDSLSSRRQTTYLIILFDVLFAIVLFIVFLIFLTAADDEAKSASRLDFVHLLPRLGAGHCFAPVISMASSRKVSIAPNHRVLFSGVQSVLLKQSTEDLRSLLTDCKPDVPLQVCLLTKVCPHFDDEAERSESQEVLVRGARRIPQFLRIFSRRPNPPVRFDMSKSEAKASRAKFVDESHFSEDLDFCNALFSYVLLSTNMSLTSNLAENYTYTLDEPHEVEHVLLIFLSEPAFAGIRRRARCSRSDIQCLLEAMCAKEVFNEPGNETRFDLEIFHKYMEHMLKPCLGSQCHAEDGWRATHSEGWFSSCWLKQGLMNNIIRSDRIEVDVPIFQRPCSQGELSRDYSIIFGVAAVYIFILALLFLLLEFLILLLYRRCSDRLTRLALAKNLIASAAIVPSLIPSRRNSPRSTPRGSQRSISENWRGRFGRGRRLGAADQLSFLGSLTGISNTQSARSVDSGLGFNTRLSTPRSASIPHLRMATGLPGRRLKATNDYVFTAFESGSMSVLPTPIIRPPTIRRSFSAREEPILNFLGETVLDGGGDILEPEEERPPQPPRPSSTPISQHHHQPQQYHPLQSPRAMISIQHSHSFNASGIGTQSRPHRVLDHLSAPISNTSSFQTFEDFEDRINGAHWRDSGVEATLISGAGDPPFNASSIQRV